MQVGVTMLTESLGMTEVPQWPSSNFWMAFVLFLKEETEDFPTAGASCLCGLISHVLFVSKNRKYQGHKLSS